MEDNKEREITFESDIIREVSEELGYDEGLVQAVYYSMMRYIQYLAKYSNYCTIVIFYLGSIYLKETFAKETINRTEDRKFLKTLKARYGRMQTVRRNPNRPKKWKFYFKQFPKYWLWHYTDDKSIVEIEELQNKDA